MELVSAQVVVTGNSSVTNENSCAAKSGGELIGKECSSVSKLHFYQTLKINFSISLRCEKQQWIT
jgi:hypothetical protein